MKIKIPPFLQPGDTIGITCPAGYMPAENAAMAIRTLQNEGYEVMVGKTLGSRSRNYFSGTDTERRNELQAMMDEAGIKAILFGRGGYGVSRIIDQLDFTAFQKKPKWLIGFSDITVLHAHCNRKLHIATLHAPMAAAFNDAKHRHPYVSSLLKVLKGEKTTYTTKAHRYNREGLAEGELIGGNLTLLAHLCGTGSAPVTQNKILFIEDVGEYLYNIDRMLIQLKRSGMLDDLAALIVGGFTECKDTERPFGKKVYEIIRDQVSEYNYPVCFQFPVSHTPKNYALMCGGKYKLNIAAKMVTLQLL